MIRTEIKKLIQEAAKSHWDVDLELAEIKVDYPPEEFGDYSTNVAMRVAKAAKSNPMEIAEDIKGHLLNGSLASIMEAKLPFFERIEVVKPGFINFYLARGILAETVLDINKKGIDFGSLEKKKGKVMVEYSQPNTHKEFHIGHLRNAFIGSALVNILRKAGNEVIAANYIGDTGTHIAKCLWALEKFHSGENFEAIKNKTEFLGKVYSEAVKAIEENPEYEKEFKEIQKKLSEEEEGLFSLWKETRQWSLDEFEDIYKKLGVSFDNYFYESEEEAAGKKMVPELVAKGIAKESKGAVIVDLEKQNLGVLVLLRSDGSVLYGLKDIPLASKKIDEYDIDRSIIIADIRQNLYFRQIFEIMKLLGFKKSMSHIGYGFVFLKGGVSMSSRKGNIIPARKLLSEVTEEVRKKFPDTPAAEEIALGALKFYTLKYSNESNIEFDIEESIKLDGATGPYLQYAYARICGILRKNSMDIPEKINFDLLSDKNEIILIKKMAVFPEIIEDIGENLRTNQIAQYALELVRDFHRFYETCKVIDEKAPELTQARLALVRAAQIVLKNALDLMGIFAPERM